MITILGGGAIGLLLTAVWSRLEQIGLVVRTKRQTESIRKNGIEIVGLKKFVTHPPNVVEFGSTEMVNLLKNTRCLFVCIKSYDTQKVFTKLSRIINRIPEMVIITLQNGLGNKEIISSKIKNKVLCGIITCGATKILDNKVKFAGKGEVVVENFNKITKWLDRIKNSIIPIKVVSNITPYLWKKFIVNCVINPLAAITKLPNGELIKYPQIKQIMKLLVEEDLKVAQNEIKISRNFINQIYNVCKKTSSNINSMLQDILAKRKTEIDFLNGKILEFAKQQGYVLPVNTAIFNLVKYIEKTYAGR